MATLSIDFFGEQPSAATHWLVKRHTSFLVDSIMRDIDTYSLKNHLKQKSLEQLYNLALCAEGDLKPHCDKLLKNVVYKLILDEEPEIAKRSLRLCELLGLHIETDYLIPMIVSHLNDQESRSVPRFVSSCLTALSAVITHSSVKFAAQFEQHIDALIKLIVQSDYLQSENVEVLDRSLRVTTNIVFAAGKQFCKPRQGALFRILLNLGSNPAIAPLTKEVDSCLDLLSTNCGLEDASDLFSQELETMLQELKEDYEQWTKHTPERFVFEMLVRRSQTAVVDYWDDILTIIATCTEKEKDFELRMDFMTLTEHFLKTESLHSTIVFYSEIILKMILLPNLQWAVGIPSQSIRKAAVVCSMTLIKQGLIEPVKLHQNFTEYINAIKNCLDDDWVAELRFASVLLVRQMMEYIRDEMDYEDFKNVYPELIKRLDDSQDGIRIEVAKTFEAWFQYLPDPWSGNLYEYVVKGIFIHIDDPSVKIQDAIVAVLKVACTKHTDQFIELAADAKDKYAQSLLCKNLETFAREYRAKN